MGFSTALWEPSLLVSAERVDERTVKAVCEHCAAIYEITGKVGEIPRRTSKCPSCGEELPGLEGIVDWFFFRRVRPEDSN